MEARDIMTTDVVSLSPEMTVEEAADVLLHYRIHGAPVIDENDQLVGMVSLVDLVGRVGTQVHNLMTQDAICAAEDTSIEEIAGMMLDEMVRRIPITRGRRVVGIVSASDIIRLFLNLHEAAPAGSAPREKVRATATGSA